MSDDQLREHILFAISEDSERDVMEIEYLLGDGGSLTIPRQHLPILLGGISAALNVAASPPATIDVLDHVRCVDGVLETHVTKLPIRSPSPREGDSSDLQSPQ